LPVINDRARKGIGLKYRSEEVGKIVKDFKLFRDFRMEAVEAMDVFP
jgi:hypothetical protein